MSGVVTGTVSTLFSMTVLAFIDGAFLESSPGRRLYAPHAMLEAYVLLVNLAMGIWAMWLYAAIRQRYRTAARAAVVTGAVWWIIVTLQSSKWVAAGFAPANAAIAPGAAGLPAIVAAVLIGAWLYED